MKAIVSYPIVQESIKKSKLKVIPSLNKPFPISISIMTVPKK